MTQRSFVISLFSVLPNVRMFLCACADVPVAGPCGLRTGLQARTGTRSEVIGHLESWMHDFADGYGAGAVGRAPIRELNRGFLPHCHVHEDPEGVGFLPGPVHMCLRACAYMRRGGGHTHGNAARQVVGGPRTEVCGQQKQSNDPRNNQHILNTPTTGRH